MEEQVANPLGRDDDHDHADEEDGPHAPTTFVETWIRLDQNVAQHRPQTDEPKPKRRLGTSPQGFHVFVHEAFTLCAPISTGGAKSIR